jgi:hypothetical protein
MNYPQSKEDELVASQYSLIEIAAYSHHRKSHSFRQLKAAEYPNVEALEVRYREMIG